MNSNTNNTSTTQTTPTISNHIREKLPHLGVNLPDPEPPIPEIINLIQKQITKIHWDRAALRNDNSDYYHQHNVCYLNSIAVLKHFTEELQKILERTPTFATANVNSGELNSGGLGKPTSRESLTIQDSPQTTPAPTNQPLTSKTQPIPPESEVSPTESQPRPDEPKPSPSAPDPSPTDSDSDALITLELTDPLYDIAEDLQYQTKGRSPFNKLTPEQQDAIYQLLQRHTAEEVSAIIAKPPPLGLNFKTCKASVNRFRTRYRDQQKKRQVAEEYKRAQSIVENSANPDQALLTVSQLFLKTRLLKSVAHPEPDLATIQQQITAITALQKQNLAERRQQQLERHQNTPHP